MTFKKFGYDYEYVKSFDFYSELYTTTLILSFRDIFSNLKSICFLATLTH